MNIDVERQKPGPLKRWQAGQELRLAELGIAPHVIERCLNHVSGTISGVAAVYNRHGYVPEKRQALDAWAARIEELIRPALAVAAS